jgi:thiol-disulfide isomerase/thioredoxin
MKKIDFLYAGVSLLTLFALAAIPKLQFKYDIWLYFPVYFLLTLLIISHKKRPPLTATIAVVAGFLIPDILVRFAEGFRDAYISIPRLIFQVSACFVALLFYSGGTVKKAVVITISVLLMGLYINYVQQYWFNFSDYGTFTGKVEKTNVFTWQVRNEKGETVDQDRYTNKIVLLDFWTTSCAVCFRKFPELEKIYQACKNDTAIIMEAVNVPLPTDTNNMPFVIMKNKPYTFPTVVGLNNIDTIFGVEVYPTTIVLRNGAIVYKGNIEGAGKTVKELRAKM